MNHSSRYRVVGAKSRPVPKAQMTPCVATSCHTVVANEESKKPKVVMTRPIGPQYPRRRGQRVRRAKVTGDERYKIPYTEVRGSGFAGILLETHGGSRPNGCNA